MIVYSALCSLDGYTVDADGSFDWCAPDEQVHAFVNDLERPVGTYLYGRRIYEVMRYWEHADPDGSAVEQDFAQLWQAADKVVYSTTLREVSTRKTRLERTVDLDAIQAIAGVVSIGGPTLAAQALVAGVVDELQLFLTPIVVGGGTRALPERMGQGLELLEQQRFDSGVVFLRYRPTG